jgi:hypothetical protein
MTERIDKDSLPLNKPRRTPNHPTKSHIVKTMVDGKKKIIRFGEQGAETAGKPKAGESERMKQKRASFKARHAENIAKGPSSAAYWADKVKWADGGSVETKGNRMAEARSIPQNATLSKLADLLSKAKDIGNKVDLSVIGGLGDLVVGETPSEVENWSYGNYPIQATEMGLPQIKRERKQSLADAVMTLAPIAKLTEDLPAGLAIKAYHGTPHKFDRFDMSKIGTGEGAQAYGHGLYFAENPGVANEYAQTLSKNGAFDGIPQYEIQNGIMGPEYMINEVKKDAILAGNHQRSDKFLDVEFSNTEDALKWLQENKKIPEGALIEKIGDPGYETTIAYGHAPQLYETSIQWPDAAREAADPLSEHHLLDWDKPLSEQSSEIQKIMSEYMLANPKMTGQQAWKSAIDKVGNPFYRFASQTGPFFSTPESAAARLNQIGIPGIKYLDQGSRAGGGTSNYVMFGDEYPQIVNRASSLDELQQKYAGGGSVIKAVKSIAKNLNKDLIEKYLSTGQLSPEEMAKYEKNALKMETPNLQRFNVENAIANPEREAYVQQFDQPWLHGSQRLDRVLSKPGLDPKKATSGPMPYGTDSPKIASNYATQKTDTSLIDDDFNYSQAFTISPKEMGLRGSSPYTVEQSWHFLPENVKESIRNNATRVGLEDYDQLLGNLTLHPEGVEPIATSHYNYLLKQNKNNPLSALRDYWIDSGNLFNEEEKLADIYKLAGYPYQISQETAPWYEAKGVLTGKSRITNPLDTSDVSILKESVIPALKDAFKTDRSRTKIGADAWDKNSRFTPKEWVNELEKDIDAGENSYVWTSIPDKVTNELKNLGYNGIYDTGGKVGGEGHQVTIPFQPNQVRSRFAAFDPLRAESSSLLAGTALGDLLLKYASPEQNEEKPENYAQGGAVQYDPSEIDAIINELHQGEYGLRPDQTEKGRGYLNELKRPDGAVMTEYSIGMPINGVEMDVPTLVPNLTIDEIKSILSMPERGKIPSSIVQKAAEHAEKRVNAGKPVFATPEESEFGER